jgi:hypothetical protein
MRPQAQDDAPAFEPMHARREIERLRDAKKPDRPKPVGKRPWRDGRRSSASRRRQTEH